MPVSYRKLLSPFKLKKLGVKSDASLLDAYSCGDASAFDMLYSRYKDVLFNSLCNQLGSANAAEEVAQDVWMAIIKGSESFKERGQSETDSFKSWLFSIAYRRTADYWRKQYREKDIVQPETVISSPEGNLQEAIDNSSTSQPEYQLELYEFRQLLNKLPEDQRQSFILREEGFSYQEIAGITEVGVETVKSRLRYAKKTLKEWLGGSYD